MASLYEFTIGLKDLASAGVDKINAGIGQTKAVMDKVETAAGKMQTAVTSAIGKLYNSAKSAVKGPQFLEHSIDELKSKLEELNKVKFGTVLKSEFDKVQKEIDQTEAKLKRLEQGISGKGLGSKLKGWRKDFANSLPGADMIANPLVGASAVMGGLWSATEKAMEAGKEKVKMQTLTGSAEVGGALYDGLTKFATDTVFGNELYDMGAQMLANGIQSADVLPIMKQLGDISMGDKEKLGSLSLAFAQIQGKGHLAGQELLQLVNAGFNPLQVISEKTGESMESLTKKMSDGEISVEDVRKAMDMATGKGGKFHEMLDKVAKTPYGQLENLKGTLDQMMVKIGEVFLPIASKMMSFFSWLSEKLGPLMQPIALVLGLLSAGLLAAAAAQWVLNLALWASPTTWIIMGVVALIGVIIYLIAKISGWGEAWKIVVNNAKLNWEVFTSGAKFLWDGMIDGFIIGLNKIKSGWYQFKNAVGIGDEGENNSALQAISDDTKRRADEIAKNKKDFDAKSLALQKGSKNAFTALKWNEDVKLADVTAGLQNKLGLTKPTATGKGKGEKLKQQAKEKSSGITSGGNKQTNIIINIDKVGTGTTINVSSVEKGLNNLGERVQEELLRAINSVNQMQVG